MQRIDSNNMIGFPRELGNYVTNNKKNWYGYELLVINKPGAIFKIGEEFAKRNVNIVLFSHSDTKSDTALLFVVGDFTKSNTDPHHLVGILNDKRDIVLDVKFADVTGDIIYSYKMFPLLLDGVRVILFGPANMSGLVLELRRHMDPDIATGLLYHLGYTVGITTFNYYMKPRGYGVTDLEKILDMLRAILMAYGWCRISSHKIDIVEGKIVLEIEDLWECNVLKLANLSLGSSYFKGVMDGLFSTVLNKKVKCVETECISKGDGICKFEIGLKEDS